MGSGQSYLQSDEVDVLLSLSSETAWSYDSEKWCNAFLYKNSLGSIPPDILWREMADFCTRIARNNAASHNLSTLAAHVSLRLPRAWYFSSTDIEMTINAVVLLRVALTHITLLVPADATGAAAVAASRGSSSSSSSTPSRSVMGAAAPTSAPTVSACSHVNLLRVPPNPAATRTRNAELESFSYEGLLSVCLDFLCLDLGPDPRMPELHTQVATLLLCLLSTQLTRTGVVSVEDFSSLLTGGGEAAAAPSQTKGKAGSSTHASNSSSSSATAGGTPPPPLASLQHDAPILLAVRLGAEGGRAVSVISSLLRNVATASSTASAASSGASSSSSSSASSSAAAAAAASAKSSKSSSAAAASSSSSSSGGGGGMGEDDVDESSSATAASRFLKKQMKAAQAGLAIPRPPDSIHPPSSSAAVGGRAASSSSSSSSAAVATKEASLLSSVLAGVSQALGFRGDEAVFPLAERSALLLLLLVHNLCTEVQPEGEEEEDEEGEDNEKARKSRVDRSSKQPHYRNPYRRVLEEMRDSDNPISLVEIAALSPPRGGGGATEALKQLATSRKQGGEGEGGASAPSPPRILLGPFKALFGSLVCLCESPLGTALLFTLRNASAHFSDFILTRSDCDELLLPLLKQLHHLNALGMEHRYMLVVTLLLFAQDAGWCETAHKRVRVHRSAISDWFSKDRFWGESMSLGSLITVLMARAVTLAPFPSVGGPTPSSSSSSAAAVMTGFGSDAFIHSNCLAAVANMAPYAEGLHPYAGDRLVALLHTLHKRHARAVAYARSLQEHAPGVVPSRQLDAAAALVSHFDECVQMVLDSICAACAPSLLPTNVSLLYTLLHDKKSVLDPLAVDVSFSEASLPLAEAVAHFADVIAGEEIKRGGAGIAAAGSGAANSSGSIGGSSAPSSAAFLRPSSSSSSPGDTAATASTGTAYASPEIIWEATEVLAILTHAARTWRGGGACTEIAASLKQEKFAYIESPRPEDFFVPYIWSLTLAFTSDCAWGCYSAFSNDSSIKLLPQQKAAQLFVTTAAAAAAPPS